MIFRDLVTLDDETQELVRVWRNSSFVSARMVSQKEITSSEHRLWIAGLSSSNSTDSYKVAYLEGQPFGVIYLKKIDPVMRTSDWGMYIGEPSLRGKGLGKKLLGEILRWGFDELELFRLYTSVLVDNVEAMALYLKAGFVIEGRWCKHVVTSGGNRVDLYWIAMLQECWNENRSRLEQWVGYGE